MESNPHLLGGELGIEVGELSSGDSLNSEFNKENGIRITNYSSQSNDAPTTAAGVQLSVTRKGYDEWLIGCIAFTEAKEAYIRIGIRPFTGLYSYSNWSKIYG